MDNATEPTPYMHRTHETLFSTPRVSMVEELDELPSQLVRFSRPSVSPEAPVLANKSIDMEKYDNKRALLRAPPSVPSRRPAELAKLPVPAVLSGKPLPAKLKRTVVNHHYTV